MPSQSGDGNRGGPWGARGGPGPDLERVIRQGQDQLRRIMPGGGPRGMGMILIVCLVLAALAVWTAFYTVPSDSVAVVQRFGKYLKDVPSGLHFKLPFGIDRDHRSGQAAVEAGIRVRDPGATDPYQSPQDGKKETQMVTGDLNAALVEWVVQYRISDPMKFLFDVREPSATLRDVSESVMREVVGDRTVDEVITIGRQEIEAKR